MLDRQELISAGEDLHDVRTVEQGKHLEFTTVDMNIHDVGGKQVKFEPVVTGNKSRYEPVVGEPAITGGMGIVMKVKDTKMDRIVAAKKAKRPYNNTFLEARTLANFRHDNIVTIHDLAMDNSKDKELYLIMEWLDGPLLEEWMQQTHQLSDVARAIDQMAAGISHLKEQGYAYGDIRPANYMFDSEGVIKLIDVGAIRELDKRGKATTINLATTYAPPEQYVRILSSKNDVYSLSVVVLEMLTGYKSRRRGYLGLDIIPKAEYMKEFKSRPIEHYNLSRILRKGMSLNPKNRQISVDQLNAQIQQVFEKMIST